ncbi:Pyruvate/Phosphoenolpyruvate kinase-like domain-containing protein [Cyathus striatus]|nr:Pyruvate/Phosphoenolpyruvate kinase-like domain-containing protein [Cyathus striatus]
MSSILTRPISRNRTRPLRLLGLRWMSVRPPSPSSSTLTNILSPALPRKKVTLDTLHAIYTSKTPITCSRHTITLPRSRALRPRCCLGYESTTQLTLDEMIHHAKAVKRGNKHPFLVADMPFGSYHVSVEDTVRNACAYPVKLEGGKEIAPIVRRLKEVGIPVIAHVGLQPQKHTSLSGYKVQGKKAEGAQKVLQDALGLQDAGAWGILVEAVPKELAKYITDTLTIPTVGIGAGPWTSGQVLVYDDVMGTWSGHKAKFGVEAYAEAVRGGTFPHEEEESYTMDKDELVMFMEGHLISLK